MVYLLMTTTLARAKVHAGSSAQAFDTLGTNQACYEIYGGGTSTIPNPLG